MIIKFFYFYFLIRLVNLKSQILIYRYREIRVVLSLIKYCIYINYQLEKVSYAISAISFIVNHGMVYYENLNIINYDLLVNVMVEKVTKYNLSHASYIQISPVVTSASDLIKL